MNNIDLLKKILLTDDLLENISVYEDKLFEMIPLLKYEKGFDQRNKWHCYDVWQHTLYAIDYCNKDFYDRFILLLHDIGKPFSYQEDEDIRHFKGHAEKSYELGKIILNDFDIDEKEKNTMLFIIRNHSNKIENIDFNGDKKLYNRFLKIQICDASAYEKTHSKKLMKKLLRKTL